MFRKYINEEGFKEKYKLYDIGLIFVERCVCMNVISMECIHLSKMKFLFSWQMGNSDCFAVPLCNLRGYFISLITFLINLYILR